MRLKLVGLLAATLIVTSATWAQDSQLPLPNADTPRKAGPGIKPPVLIKSAEPSYPKDLYGKADGSATITVHTVVDRKGNPTDLKIVRSAGNESLDKSALDAVSHYRFKPATESGEPVPVELNFNVSFQIGRTSVMSRDLPQANQAAGTIVPPKILHQHLEPQNAPSISCTVIVGMVVTVKGKPSKLQILQSSDPACNFAALDSISTFRFQPATQDGQPFPAELKIEIGFAPFRSTYDVHILETP